MTNHPTDSESQDHAPAAPARRPNPIAGRLGAARSAVLGRGLDALLGNLGRPAPKQHDPAPDPAPDTSSEEEAQARKYQAQARRALLSRMQTSAPAPAPATSAPITPPAPSRSDLGRGFVHLMQAGQSAHAVAAATTGGESDENRVVLVEVERLEPSPYHGEPRRDPETLRGLAQSVRELGIWQPLVVMPATSAPGDGGPRYWIISGQQRWEAAQMVGLREVPVLVRQVSPRAGLQMALADEEHQECLSPLARCRLYRVLTGDMGMTIEDTAARIGVDAHEIVACLAVLEADAFLQDSFERGEISAEVVTVLMQAPTPEARRELWRYALRYRWDAPRLSKALRTRGMLP